MRPHRRIGRLRYEVEKRTELDLETNLDKGVKGLKHNIYCGMWFDGYHICPKRRYPCNFRYERGHITILQPEFCEYSAQKIRANLLTKKRIEKYLKMGEHEQYTSNW